jgi:hypothetical protein
MSFRPILIALAILAGSILAVAVLVLRPALMAYVIGVFTPCAAIFILEGSKSRFAWIGATALTLASAGPIVFGALLDPSRNVMNDMTAWAVPIGASIAGTIIAMLIPAIGENMTAREQTGQFAKLEARQTELIAQWGEELREPLNPPS